MTMLTGCPHRTGLTNRYQAKITSEKKKSKPPAAATRLPLAVALTVISEMTMAYAGLPGRSFPRSWPVFRQMNNFGIRGLVEARISYTCGPELSDVGSKLHRLFRCAQDERRN